MRDMITLPGIGDSDNAHWQTAWEQADARFTRFQPASWDEPDLDDWMQSLERAVSGRGQPPVLVAHSLACLLVSHWASQSTSQVAGAFLVSVPDPDGRQFPAAATLDHTRQRALAWQSGLVVAGALGHINASSGLGHWPQGRALLDAFCAGLPRGG